MEKEYKFEIGDFYQLKYSYRERDETSNTVEYYMTAITAIDTTRGLATFTSIDGEKYYFDITGKWFKKFFPSGRISQANDWDPVRIDKKLTKEDCLRFFKIKNKEFNKIKNEYLRELKKLKKEMKLFTVSFKDLK